MRYRLDTRAEEELAEAAFWYREKGFHLSDRFLDAVETALERIAERPRLYAEVYEEIRRAPVAGFPYSVFYIPRTGLIQVLAVIHDSRDPKAWQERAETP